MSIFYYFQHHLSIFSYLVVVVLVKQPVAVGVDLLVALVGAAHAQSRIHVHVVAGQVQRD